MSLESIIIVVLYSMKPYWWAVALLVLIPIICFVARPGDFSIPGKTAAVVGLVLGLIAGIIAPALTLSGLGYVATVTDWVAILGIIIGAAIYVWINLRILSIAR